MDSSWIHFSFFISNKNLIYKTPSFINVVYSYLYIHSEYREYYMQKRIILYKYKKPKWYIFTSLYCKNYWKVMITLEKSRLLTFTWIKSMEMIIFDQKVPTVRITNTMLSCDKYNNKTSVLRLLRLIILGNNSFNITIQLIFQ